MLVVENIFNFQRGDILQICEDNNWTDLGTIFDPRMAAKKLVVNNFTVMNKPARVIRR